MTTRQYQLETIKRYYMDTHKMHMKEGANLGRYGGDLKLEAEQFTMRAIGMHMKRIGKIQDTLEINYMEIDYSGFESFKFFEPFNDGLTERDYRDWAERHELLEHSIRDEKKVIKYKMGHLDQFFNKRPEITDELRVVKPNILLDKLLKSFVKIMKHAEEEIKTMPESDYIIATRAMKDK